MSAAAIGAGRIIAEQQCVGFPMQFPATTTRWGGLGPEALNYLQSASGVKNLICKPVSYAVNTAHFMVDVTPDVAAFGKACNDTKNALAMAELPGKITGVFTSVEGVIADPSVATTRKAVLGVLGPVSPTVDVVHFLNSRGVISLAPETLKGLSQASAGALLVAMTDRSVTSGTKIAEAVGVLCEAPLANQVNFDERAEVASTALMLSLIDLAMAVSFVALACIALISAFVVTIESAGFCILMCSISALFFTIIGEFAQRAYNPNPNKEVIIPPVRLQAPAPAPVPPPVPPAGGAAPIIRVQVLPQHSAESLAAAQRAAAAAAAAALAGGAT